jgi:hypothetical protein
MGTERVWVKPHIVVRNGQTFEIKGHWRAGHGEAPGGQKSMTSCYRTGNAAPLLVTTTRKLNRAKDEAHAREIIDQAGLNRYKLMKMVKWYGGSSAGTDTSEALNIRLARLATRRRR